MRRVLLSEGKTVEAETILTRDFLRRYSEAYMPLGDLKIEFGHEFREKSYRRSLDLSRSVCAVEYETPDGVRFTREMFVSAPDQTLIVAQCPSEKGALGFTASLNTQLCGAVRAIGNGICLDARRPSHAKPEYVHDPNPLEWSDVPEKMGVRFCACRRTD